MPASGAISSRGSSSEGNHSFEIPEILSQEEKGSLRPEMGKAAFPLGFRKEEAPRMTFSARFEEFHTGNAIGIVSDRWEIRAGAPVAV